MSIQLCSSPEVFQTQIPENVEKITHLKTFILRYVSKLQSIVSENSSWLNVICARLQQLYVLDCPDLKTLVHSTPSVSFRYVKEIYIDNCQDMKYLFPLSAVNKLENLEYIEVKNCKSMEAIVLKDKDDISEEIKLQKLKWTDLYNLSNLECFYSDNLQLPSFMQVNIWKCPKMKFFYRGDKQPNSSFRGIQALNLSSDELACNQDINSLVEKVFLHQEFSEAVHTDCYSDYLELQCDLVSEIDMLNKLFANLETLKLQKCTVSYAIPSSILALLKNLKELEVRDSDQVETIFDTSRDNLNDDTEIKETEFHLKILSLNGLSKLTHVWKKDTHKIIIFCNLQEVVVSDCAKLQTLFPTSLEKSLKDLKRLKIENCKKFQDFVEQEETIFVTERFVFPCLEDLELKDLPQVTCPNMFTLEFPSLKFLSVRDCDGLGLFQSVYDPMGEGTSSRTLPLISDPNVISNLVKLTLDWKQILALSLWFKSQQSTEGLTNLKSISWCFFRAKENEMPMLPVEILKAPILEEMDISKCESLANFLAQNPKIGEEEMLGQLTKLKLRNVSVTQFSELEYSSSLNIFKRLHKLFVARCPHLATLGIHSTSTMSFSCLKEVNIYKCPKLKYLFTSSAAKMLMNLQEISVTGCELLTEIVVKEGDATSEAIEFERLHTIHLESLTCLVCFYSGSNTLQLSSLNFPSLKNVWIKECFSTKIFRRHDNIPPKCRVHIDGSFKGDTKVVIMEQSEEEAS
ncbi:uncharacterized protein HKW66_Vig0171860 [Vigna angularis]|nr:uncharacterized protein HKW66_Vig0171860 [Vigna angularis]